MITLLEMLQAGGNTALIMGLAGLLCTVWGVYQYRHPPQNRHRVFQVICSMTPALLGLWIFYGMFSSYTHIAQSTVAPTRAEFDLFVSDAVVFGCLSILGTLIPISLAIAGLMKNQSATNLAG